MPRPPALGRPPWFEEGRCAYRQSPGPRIYRGPCRRCTPSAAARPAARERESGVIPERPRNPPGPVPTGPTFCWLDLSGPATSRLTPCPWPLQGGKWARGVVGAYPGGQYPLDRRVQRPRLLHRRRRRRRRRGCHLQAAARRTTCAWTSLPLARATCCSSIDAPREQASGNDRVNHSLQVMGRAGRASGFHSRWPVSTTGMLRESSRRAVPRDLGSLRGAPPPGGRLSAQALQSWGCGHGATNGGGAPLWRRHDAPAGCAGRGGRAWSNSVRHRPGRDPREREHAGFPQRPPRQGGLRLAIALLLAARRRSQLLVGFPSEAPRRDLCHGDGAVNRCRARPCTRMYPPTHPLPSGPTHAASAGEPPLHWTF